jgi:hypothetical protein
MKTKSASIVFWVPRVLCLLFAAFLSMFALDVFNEARGFWPTLGALFMHLIPTWILLILLALSWRWEWVGAVAFPALGIFYLVNFWGRFHWSAYALISGPLILLGVLFLLSWRQRRGVRVPRAATT